MKSLRVLIVALVVTFAASTVSLAAQAAQGTKLTPQDQTQTPPPKPVPPQTPPPTPPKPTPPPTPKELTYEETIVVSASKTEQKIVDAPATMSVFTPKMLEDTPAANYGDLLRTVPGVNVTQLSARDINITSRGATGSLSTSQLAVLDGRSLYQDFFGFIMWDFMPADMNEIKQIEVIRGPASAVWGANALSGVVNIITKTPREMRGASIDMGAGTFNKEVNKNGAKGGNLFFVNGSVADAINAQWAYKLSAGFYSTDAFARPTGLIPNGGTTSYPVFTNQGTRQPKFDARLDRDFSDGQHLSFAAGAAGTSGIMETGIGPFKINNGTYMAYGKASYTNKAFHAQAFMNALDGNAPNLLTVDTTGQPIQFKFVTKTFDFETGNSSAVGSHNVFTYGGNLRVNKFHLTLAPGETSRTEGGGYLQDEIFFNDHVRLVAGARVDKFSSISSAVFSPRVALVLKPASNQTFRLSYNRAFRAPSMVNNNLDVTISNPLPLAAVNAALRFNLFPATSNFLVPTHASGNPNLTEEHVDAYEVSYTGKIGAKSLFSAAVYYNKTANSIFFTVAENYGLTTPPTGWTSMPQWSALGPAGVPTAIAVWKGVQTVANFPKEYTYKNLGTTKDKGLELGFDSAFGPTLTYYVNYSYQAQPIPEFPGLTATQALAEVNLPSKHRVNYGMTASIWKLFYTMNASFAGEAYWQDVLDARYAGKTPKYTISNLVIGTKFNQDKAVLQLKVNNLGNVAVQQHIFGDIIKRQIVVELKINAPKR